MSLLLSLSHAQNAQQAPPPPPPVALQRSLSHADKAMEMARPYLSQLKEGETLFINYWVDARKTITYAWLELNKGVLRQFQKECPLKDLPRDWTYESVPCP